MFISASLRSVSMDIITVSSIMYKEIVFKKDGYEPFWDFLKGYSIICVILHHCLQPEIKNYLLFCLWGETAVPLFIILQVYHYYRKPDIPQFDRQYCFKVWNRVLKPFFITEIFLIPIYIFYKCVFFDEIECIDVLKLVIVKGGLGWGAYYPWIYLQIAFILLIVSFFLSKLSSKYYLLFFIVVSELFEVFCSIFDISDTVYRLLFTRYFFLIWGGYRLAKYGIKMNKVNFILSLLSILFILIFKYFKFNVYPFFYTKPVEWEIAHWICYFYVLNLLMYLLYRFYCWIRQFENVLHLILEVGKKSYFIFLLQMSYFCFLSPYDVYFSNYKWICWPIYYVSTLCFCLMPVFIYIRK